MAAPAHRESPKFTSGNPHKFPLQLRLYEKSDSVVRVEFILRSQMLRELNVAEACASRTHRRRENPPPAGFEDHLECSERL